VRGSAELIDTLPQPLRDELRGRQLASVHLTSARGHREAEPDGPEPITGVVDVATDAFLGVRSASGLHKHGKQHPQQP